MPKSIACQAWTGNGFVIQEEKREKGKKSRSVGSEKKEERKKKSHRLGNEREKNIYFV